MQVQKRLPKINEMMEQGTALQWNEKILKVALAGPTDLHTFDSLSVKQT